MCFKYCFSIENWSYIFHDILLFIECHKSENIVGNNGMAFKASGFTWAAGLFLPLWNVSKYAYRGTHTFPIHTTLKIKLEDSTSHSF